jgi:hypothetical protein
VVKRLITGLVVVSFLVVKGTSAQVHVSDARGLALGGASASLDGLSGTVRNPAGLATESKLSVVFGYLRLYGLSELAERSTILILPARKWVSAVGLGRFGFDRFSETTLLVSVAAGERTKVGISARAGLARFAGYATHGGLNLDLGWSYELNSSITLAGSLSNVGTGGSVVSGATLETGLSASLTSESTLVIASSLTAGSQADFRFGLEHRITRPLAVRLGGHLDPGIPSAGFGLDVGRIRADLAWAYHPRLQSTVALTLRLIT